MEDEGEAGGHNPDSRPDRAWFSRATQLLRQILEQWKRQRFPAAGREVDSPGLGASPEAVAEAILNSVHCCVAAVGASLVIPTSGKPGLAKQQQDLDRNVGVEGVVREAGVGMTNKRGPTGPLGVPVAQAFRRIGEAVGVAAGLDQLGDALLRRCSSLLAKPNRCVTSKGSPIASVSSRNFIILCTFSYFFCARRSMSFAIVYRRQIILRPNG